MNEKKHPVVELPDDPHAKQRYESALKHVQFAKAAGKSSAEIHEIFRKVMNFDPNNLAEVPRDEAHKQYHAAMLHARMALENGKSAEEAHRIFKTILNGEADGKCPHQHG